MISIWKCECGRQRNSFGTRICSLTYIPVLFSFIFIFFYILFSRLTLAHTRFERETERKNKTKTISINDIAQFTEQKFIVDGIVHSRSHFQAGIQFYMLCQFLCILKCSFWASNKNRLLPNF